MKKFLCFCAVAGCAVFSSSMLCAAALQPGQPAPELKFTKLLQAPKKQKTNPAALKGKVVVLEFWATWCAPCIAEIPHLNQLAASLHGSNVQFIAVDDEDTNIVKKFLGKKPMAGWIGLDSTKSVFKNYGIETRPATVVIDTEGTIAAVTSPAGLKQEQLAALAEGKHVDFPKDENAAMREEALKMLRAGKDKDTSSMPAPLIEIALRPGNPDGRSMISMRGGDGISYDFKDVTLGYLLSFTTNLPNDRITVRAAPKAHYSMHLQASSSDMHQLAPAVEAVLASALGVKFDRVTAEEDVYLLKTTGKASSLLTPSASKNESMCFIHPSQNRMMMVKAKAADIASALENNLDTPVVDDTGLTGEYDASFDFPKTDAAGASAVLERNLGLTLVKARRAVERLIVEAPAGRNTAPPAAIMPIR